MMPFLSRYMIRTAFLNLIVGFGLATLLMAQKAKPDLVDREVASWLLVHVDLLLVGWMVQLSFGVAYWILPRLPDTLTERGRFYFALNTALMLNLGVWLYAVGIFADVGWLQIIGLVCQISGMFSFAIHIAPRVRPAFVTPTQNSAS